MHIEKVRHGTGYEVGDWVEFILYDDDGNVLRRRDKTGQWWPCPPGGEYQLWLDLPIPPYDIPREVDKTSVGYIMAKLGF